MRSSGGSGRTELKGDILAYVKSRKEPRLTLDVFIVAFTSGSGGGHDEGLARIHRFVEADVCLYPFQLFGDFFPGDRFDWECALVFLG